MTQTDQIRNSIIDKLLAINNPEVLSMLNDILGKKEGNVIKLSDAQRKMLEMSEEDILAGRVISQEELNQRDGQWRD